MQTARLCPNCGAALFDDSPQGMCPRCALQLGIAPSGFDGVDATRTTGSGFQRAGFIPPKPAELAPHFPQLEILDLIGQGGMGAVYKARQRGLDRIVALKILPPAASQDPSFAERFQREAKALARLNHPQIVSIFDSGQAGGLFYFLMEYVDGVNLRQAIQSRSLSPREALAIVPQLCDALQYAHDQGVVHRDIKPENLLLDAKGHVKIADFGLARLLGPSSESFTLTGPHQVMGTPRYMAPEQIEGSHDVDHRADIYSMGVVFYEMLTHELPIGRFAPPSRKVQLDVRLDEVVLRTLEKEPELRFQQASEVKSALESISAMNYLPVHLRRMYGYEYRSQAEVFGIPLVHIAYGTDPRTHRRRVAKGIIAIGDFAIGGFAFGGMALGMVAFGGLAMGLVTFGGLSVGLLGAIGGAAIGMGVSVGGLAVGSVAIGGCAVGIYALGGGAFGLHPYGGNARDGSGREFFTPAEAFRARMAIYLFALPFVLFVLAMFAGLVAWAKRTMFPAGNERIGQENPIERSYPTRRRNEASGGSGCAVAAIVLMLVGFPLLLALLLGGYLLLFIPRARISAAAEQLRAAEAAERALAEHARAKAERNRFEAEQAEVVARSKAEFRSRIDRASEATGVDWMNDRPHLTESLRQKLAIPIVTADQVNQILQTVHAEYREREEAVWQQERLGQVITTSIKVPRLDISELEERLWSRLDAVLSEEQLVTMRAELKLAPAEQTQFPSAPTDASNALPGILGWGTEEVMVEIARHAGGFSWKVRRGSAIYEVTSSQLPPQLRRFWVELAEKP